MTRQQMVSCLIHQACRALRSGNRRAVTEHLVATLHNLNEPDTAGRVAVVGTQRSLTRVAKGWAALAEAVSAVAV